MLFLQHPLYFVRWKSLGIIGEIIQDVLLIELEEAHTRSICDNKTMYLNHILLMLTVVNRFILCCENYAKSSNIFEKNHVAALILARGGSKGIKLKNLSTLGNSTLLEISLNEMDKLTGVDSVWVSTDHELILKKIENRDVNVHWRSAESATDEASSLKAVQEFLRHHRHVDVLGLVQCTSPFVKSSYLQEGLDAVLQRGRECSFSASRSYKLRWKKDGDRFVPVNFDPSKRPRRQDFEYDFVENGMFYFATRTLIRKGYFQSDNQKYSTTVMPTGVWINEKSGNKKTRKNEKKNRKIKNFNSSIKITLSQ